MRNVPLLVLGAGVDGLGAALALAHQGFPVHVLDRGPDPLRAPPGAGSGVLMPDACRELAALGLHDRVRTVAVEAAALVHVDAATGRPLQEVDLGATVRERFGFPVLCLPPGELRRVLAAACADDDMISVEYDARPTTVDDVVDAALVGDADGPTHRAEALVAADGLDSRARLLLGDGAPLAPPYGVHTADADVVSPDPVLRMYSSPVLHAAAAPGGGVWLAARADLARPDLDAALDRHLPELRDAIAPVLGGGPPRITGHHRPLARWTRHRIAVLGEAAQPLLPHGGHIAAQSLLDAAALGRAFDRCDGRVLEAFELYARVRAPARLRAAHAVAEFAGLCHADGLARRLRDRLWSGHVPDPLAEVVGAA